MKSILRRFGFVLAFILGGICLAGDGDPAATEAGEWQFADTPCVRVGDVRACVATFVAVPDDLETPEEGGTGAVSAHAAGVAARVVVDQDSPLWGKRSIGQKTCEFERTFSLTEPMEIRLSAKMVGTLEVEGGVGEAAFVTRVAVFDPATFEAIEGLEISVTTAPGRFLRTRGTPGVSEIEDTADRIALLPAGTYTVRASVIAYAEIDRGWRNHEAEARGTLEVSYALAPSSVAVERPTAEFPDHIVVPLGVEGTSYVHLRPGTPGGTLYVATISDPMGWNSVTSNENSTTQYTNLMLRGLVDIDPNTSDVVPELAKGWDTSEDGLTLTFHLRRGLRWSDGAPFTADDVLFTYNDLYFNPDVDTNTRSILRLPDGTYPQVEKLDDYTVRVSLSMPFRPILTALGASILPQHKLERYIHKLHPDVPADAFNGTWGLDTDPSELAGMGPFVLESYEVNQYVILRRNPHYYHYDPNGVQLPYLDRYVVRIVENQDVSLLKFLNREVHAFAPRPDDLGVLVERASGAGFTVLVDPDVPVFGTSWIAVNQDIGLAQGTHEKLRTLFRDLRFRKAIAHCVDKGTIISNVYGDLAVPQWSPVSYLSPFYAGRTHYGGPVTEEDAVVYEFDLAKARALLDEIGVVDADGDGWRDFPDGSPLAIEFNTNPNTIRQAICLIVTDDLREIGLDVTFQTIDFNTLVTRLTTSMVEMVLLSLSGGTEPNSGANVYDSTGGLHFWHYSAASDDLFEVEARVDELLAAGVATYDNDEAFEIYKEFQILFTEGDLGLVFTVNPTFVYAYYDSVANGNVANPIATPSGTNGLTMDLVFLETQ